MCADGLIYLMRTEILYRNPDAVVDFTKDVRLEVKTEKISCKLMLHQHQSLYKCR